MKKILRITLSNREVYLKAEKLEAINWEVRTG